MPSRPFRIGRSTTGLGLFATKPIKRAVRIAAYRGRRITREEADRRIARGAAYMFEVNRRWTIDGSARWNLARYINHSCRPNAKAVGHNGGIVIVAQRHIEPGEEITYDYGPEYLNYFLQNGGCRCAPCLGKKGRGKKRKGKHRRKMIFSKQVRDAKFFNCECKFVRREIAKAMASPDNGRTPSAD